MTRKQSQEQVETPLGASEVNGLFERVSSALASHSDIVRELYDFREMLAKQQRVDAEARMRAERVAECLMSFLQALGHDIRTPFIGIDSTMQLLDLEAPRLSETELRARVAADTHAARLTCAYGLAMVGDLFELLRANSDRWRFEPAPTDLLSLVGEVREVVHPQAHAKGLEIVVRLVGCSAADVGSVWTDRTRLKQSLLNIVANAVKFSERGVIEIDIACGDAFELRVRDRGPGLDPAMIPELFEPFHQGVRTAARAGEGLGLGLAIAQRCAHLLGGAWTAANRADGPGAVFTLCLPRAEVPAEPETTASQAATATQRRQRALRVLVVDDAADAARLARHHLLALGHAVTVVGTARDAARSLAAGAFDLVISDIELPDGSVLDVLTQAGPTPVLCSSARPAGSPEYARAAGALPKPITREAVRDAIERLFGALGASSAPSSRQPK